MYDFEKSSLTQQNVFNPQWDTYLQNQSGSNASLSRQKDCIDIKRPTYDESIYGQGARNQSNSNSFQHIQNPIPQSCTVVSGDTIHSTQEPIFKNTCNSNKKIAGFASAKTLFDEKIKSTRASSKNRAHFQKPYEIFHQTSSDGISHTQMSIRRKQSHSFNENSVDLSDTDGKSLFEHQNSDTIPCQRMQGLTNEMPKNFIIG